MLSLYTPEPMLESDGKRNSNLNNTLRRSRLQFTPQVFPHRDAADFHKHGSSVDLLVLDQGNSG